MTKTSQSREARELPMLTVTGQVALAEVFLTEIERTVTDALHREFEKWGEQSKSASAAIAPAALDGVELAPAQQAAAASARAQSGVQLGLKEGQGLIDSRALARYLDISHRSLYKLMVTHELPKPLSFGRSKRWIVEEIQAWVYAGCPNEDRWDRTRKLAIRDYRSWTTPVKK